jgi:CIC family chloride channel protein
VLSRHWRGRSIYEALLEQDGVRLQEHAAADVLEEGEIDSMIASEREYHSFARSEHADAVARTSHSSEHQRVFPVLDADRHLLGIITPDELEILAAEPELLPLTTASDLMRSPVSVQPGDTLRTALDAMVKNGISQVPVIDDTGHFLCLIDEAQIAKAYLRARHGTANIKGHSEHPDGSKLPS